jgi:hypothetical protein
MMDGTSSTEQCLLRLRSEMVIVWVLDFELIGKANLTSQLGVGCDPAEALHVIL